MLTLDDLMAVLPPDELESLAVEYGLDRQRQVRLSGPTLLMCLLNGLLNHHELTLRLLEETYRMQTGETADHSSFGKCLARIEPAYFAKVFRQLYDRLSEQVRPSEQRALRVRWVDATIVTLSAKLLHWGLYVPTCNKDRALRYVKSVVEINEQGLPDLLRICQDKKESNDSVALGATMLAHCRPGDLWVFDKGCHGRARMLELHQAQAFWLTPHSLQHVHTDEQTVFEIDPKDLPEGPPDTGQSPFVLTCVKTGLFQNSQPTGKWKQMPLVLVYGLRFDKRSRQWKELVLMTNLPLSDDRLHVGPFTFEELALLYRERWQLEVFFKFIKQHLSYKHLTSRTENGIRVMVYVALIAALLLIWYQRETGIDRGWRSVKFWLAENVRLWTQQLLALTPLANDTG